MTQIYIITLRDRSGLNKEIAYSLSLEKAEEHLEILRDQDYNHQYYNIKIRELI